MGYVSEVVRRCLSYPDETEWFEFKKGAVTTIDDIGEYISALSNGAAIKGEPYGYIIWGIDNSSHEIVGTDFNYTRDVKSEPFEHLLFRNVSPAIFCRFEEDEIEGKRIVVLTIPSARIVPTSYKGERLIRMGSSKVVLRNNPEREAFLFRVLNYGPRSLLNTESRFSELSFDQLFLYYEMKGIKLNQRTFKSNLELLTQDKKYNMLAQLLSDNPHVPIRFSVFNGTTKASTMYAVREYGNMCLLLSLDKVLDFGDTLNIPQADERDRKVERKEVKLFSEGAFREAVINAFVHNNWLTGASPMFTYYEDRIEIVSFGSLPPGQTRDGFFEGLSIPVNMKLAEIFLQLHISERSGRGVPRIVSEYGKEAFDFRDNAIVVTIPFNRLNPDNSEDRALHVKGNIRPVAAENLQAGPDVSPVEDENIEQKLMKICADPKGILEISTELGYKDKKTVRKYLKPLLENGCVVRTIPEKPNSRFQKYLSIK